MANDNNPVTVGSLKSSLPRMGRRRFVEGLLAAGFSASTAVGLSKDDVRNAASDQVPIVVGYRKNGAGTEPTSVVRNVPSDWYSDLQRARRVKDRLESQIVGRAPFTGIETNPGLRGGRNARVTVFADPAHRTAAREEVPEEVDGVPVRVIARRGVVPGGCSLSDPDGSSTIEGGLRAVAEYGEARFGTMASQVFDANDNERFATAYHLFKKSNGNNPVSSGDEIRHDGTKVGEVTNTHCYLDVVLAKPVNGYSPQREIAGAPFPDVTGWFAKDGASDLVSQGENVNKSGCRTGETMGPIKSADHTVWFYGCTPKNGQIRWGLYPEDFDDGDSGGPIYDRAPDGSSNSWILGHANWYETDVLTGDERVGGTSAWKINNQTGYEY